MHYDTNTKLLSHRSYSPGDEKSRILQQNYFFDPIISTNLARQITENYRKQ